MCKYTIVIHGEGQHHDGSVNDALDHARLFVESLKEVGHTIHSAIFNHTDNTKTDDLNAQTQPPKEPQETEEEIAEKENADHTD